jgi:hypothetical protein
VTKKIPAVEAKGETPAAPEKVQASHILVKSEAVPSEEEIVKNLKTQDERQQVQKIIVSTINESAVEAAEEFKHLLPPKAKPAEKAAEKAEVEKPAKK